MGFPERIEGTGKGMSLFSQWCLMGTGNTQVKILKFRNASESVFPGNLEHISSNGVSLSSNSLSSVFWCTHVHACKISPIYVLGVNFLINVCVSCVSWCMRCVRVKTALTQNELIMQLLIAFRKDPRASFPSFLAWVILVVFWRSESSRKMTFFPQIDSLFRHLFYTS